MDRYKTFAVACKGGLILTADPLTLASQFQGSATFLINYEASQKGGYRRIGGHQKLSTTAVPGSGAVLGVAVFGAGVIACRGVNVYYGTGGSWGSPLNGTARTGAVKYRFARYNWTGVDRIMMVDGANHAARWDGTTYTSITHINAPNNGKYIETFANHIFIAGYSANPGAIRWSGTLDDADWSVAKGGGELVVGDTVVGLKTFRNELIIFCQNSIFKLTGTSAVNFVLERITDEIGCVAPDSIQEIGGDLVFLAPDGVRPLGATARIGDVQLASVSRQIQPVIVGNDITTIANIASVVVPSLNVYRLYYNDTTVPDADGRGISGSPLRSVAETPAFGGWEWAELSGTRPFCMDFGYVNNEEYIVFGDYNGFVHRQEQGDTFDGVNISALYVTSPMVMDDPNVRKIPHSLKLAVSVETTTELQINAVFDLQDTNTLQPQPVFLSLESILALYGNGVYGSAEYGANPSGITRKIYTAGSGMYVQYAFFCSGPTNAHTIQGFTIEYLLGGRR